MALPHDIDETIPLKFETGWVHLDCGGAAEKAYHYGDTYCTVCKVMVPSKTVGKAIDMVYNPIGPGEKNGP